jgi:hypothetical protein
MRVFQTLLAFAGNWMLPGAAVAAERAGLPALALVHCPLPLPVAGVPPLGLGLRSSASSRVRPAVTR